MTEDRPRSVKRASTPQRAKTPQRAVTPKTIPPNDVNRTSNCDNQQSSGLRKEKWTPVPKWLSWSEGAWRTGLGRSLRLTRYLWVCFMWLFVKYLFRICEFCDEGDRNLGTKRGREDHYAVSCMMMNRCRYCQKVLLVSLYCFAMTICQNGKWKRELEKKKFSPAGNWTRVSHVTDADTHHYTTEDALVAKSLSDIFQGICLAERQSIFLRSPTSLTTISSGAASSEILWYLVLVVD